MNHMTDRRPLIVALAVVMSVLVATAPVAASHQLETVSIHTTDTDFNAGTTTNMSVNGSGDSATVEFGPTLDDFEDGDLDEYSGNKSDFSISTTTVFEGSSSLNATGNGAPGEASVITRTDHNITQGSTFTWHEQLNSSDSNAAFLFAVQAAVGHDEVSGYFVQARAGSLRIFRIDNGSITELVANTTVTVPTGEFLEATTEWGTDGSINATVRDSGGNVVATASTTDTNYTSGGFGFREFDGTTWFDLAELTGDSGSHINDHTAGNTEQGSVNITENVNATITVTYRGDSDGDGTFDTLLNETSGITTAANHTFTWSTFSGDNVQVNVTTFNASGNGKPSVVMADESVQFTASEPVVDNSSASPTGGVSTDEPTLSIDINDSDFQLSQGDTVTVEFFVDGSSEGTDTLTSNGTAELQVGPLTGGDHTWNVTATDEYGHSVDSQEFSISVPSNLTIREERPVHDIINDRTIELTFYEQTDTNPTIVNKTTSDGNVSLEGLPVGSEFTVVITTDGYYNRTILIDDIFTQSDVFLLNTSADVANVTFDISDPVGDFAGEDTEIVVQRAINESLYNDSGGFSFMAVEGDEIGAAGEIRTTLQVDQRYQLEVRNAEETRVLGGYTAEVDDAHTLRPSVPDVNVTDEQGYDWNASTDAEANTITFEFLDPDDNTTDLELVIYEQNNASNEIYNQTHAGPHGYLKVTQMLTDAQANKTWAVNYSATRESEAIGGERAVGRKVIDTLPQLDDTWKHAVAVIITILTGALFSVRNAETGAITTSFVGGGFWMGGWLPTEAGGAIMVALFIAVLWKTQAGRFG